jgi:hypothetical protein
MPSLDPLRIGLIAVVLVVVLGAAWWVTEPLRARKANEAAAGKVTATTAASTQQGAAKAVETNATTEKRIAVVEERARNRLPRVVGDSAGGDADREFFDGVCGTGLYKDDPRCGGGGSAGRADRRSK